jgi:hypothetical protein
LSLDIVKRLTKNYAGADVKLTDYILPAMTMFYSVYAILAVFLLYWINRKNIWFWRACTVLPLIIVLLEMYDTKDYRNAMQEGLLVSALVNSSGFGLMLKYVLYVILSVTLIKTEWGMWINRLA